MLVVNTSGMLVDFSIVLFIVTFFQVCLSVRFAFLGVPGAVLRGEGVWLNCGYDLEDDELYSVKWYKNNYEFYRYLPSDQPPSQKYQVEGVNVNIELSNASHAYLESIDLNTEGTYACEVSTDAPSFRTVRAEKDMFVYVMPDADPVIVGVLNRYPIGDEVNVTCFFGPSKPGADLTWYINGEAVLHSYVSEHRSKSGQDGVESVESRLQFVVDPDHLWKGALNLECTASLAQVFYKSSEEIIVGDGTSGSEFNRVTQVAPGLEAPSITGNMPTYTQGDLVDVNCTSARSLHKAKLQWEINDEEANSEYLFNHRPIIYADGRISTRLGLRFQVSDERIKSGEEMRLRCTSTMSKLIELTSMETVFAGAHRSSGLLDLVSRSQPSIIFQRQQQLYYIFLLALYFLFILR